MHGPAFYDDEQVFARYSAHRRRPENPNDTMERPALLELIGELAGLRILDLGCGDAAFGREALQRGCHSYTGLEGSHNMLAAARNTLAGTPGTLIHTTVEDWEYPPAGFELVVARLVLHYVADLAALCGQVYQTLAPGGRFVFSVEHPVISSCDRGWQPGTQRQDWLVDDYFNTGERITDWLGGRVRKYHRTLEDYFRMLQGAGFIVEQLREATPQREHFPDEATYQRRRRIPLFLLLAGRKPV